MDSAKREGIQKFRQAAILRIAQSLDRCFADLGILGGGDPQHFAAQRLLVHSPRRTCQATSYEEAKDQSTNGCQSTNEIDHPAHQVPPFARHRSGDLQGRNQSSSQFARNNGKHNALKITTFSHGSMQ
jgi:hypothetical protein